MDTLSINLEELENYSDLNNINTEIDNLRVLKYDFKYHCDKEYLNTIILEHIKNLEKELFINNTELIEELTKMIPTINSTHIKKIEPKFGYLDDVIKNKIISYMYWKYKNENNTGKINMQSLKKLFGLKEKKEYYIIPLQYNITCPKCNGNGIIYLYNYELDYMKYKCLNCEHKEEKISYHDQHNILLNCYCKNCIDIKEKLYNEIKYNLKNLINTIKNKFIEEYFKLDDIEIPSDRIMKEDFKLYSSILNKDEREVLSFNPTTVEEILKIIMEIKSRDSNYSRKNTALENFFKHKVIYGIKNKMNKDKIDIILSEIIINRFLYFQANKHLNFNDKIKYLNELYNYLEMAPYDKFYKIYIDEFCFEIEDIYIKFNNMKNHKYLSVDLNDKCFIPDVVINNYYTKQQMELNSNEILIKNKVIKRIFKSDPEANKYIIFKNIYKDYIILPNYKMRQMINLECIAQLLSKKEYEYLSGCELDFTICDKEGYIVKVIELQKGGHHNDPEWIWKDNTKKKACGILGIEFEEDY
ncbi:hypothetical protein [Clostridium botulinum]|uniref:hypothetical protein n=1 Tax=Clostridium botulinum TaxID=1491 RepID=UPI003DA3EF7C